MNIRKLAVFAVVVLNAAIISSLLAQGGRAGRLYDPSTESTVQGKVTKVDAVTGQRGWSGIHLIVASQGQQYEVHVGPAAYVERNGFAFSVGDSLDIVGSEVLYNGAKAVIAREIKKNGKTLALRDKQGFPMWSGRSMSQ